MLKAELITHVNEPNILWLCWKHHHARPMWGPAGGTEAVTLKTCVNSSDGMSIHHWHLHQMPTRHYTPSKWSKEEEEWWDHRCLFAFFTCRQRKGCSTTGGVHNANLMLVFPPYFVWIVTHRPLPATYMHGMGREGWGVQMSGRDTSIVPVQWYVFLHCVCDPLLTLHVYLGTCRNG